MKEKDLKLKKLFFAGLTALLLCLCGCVTRTEWEETAYSPAAGTAHVILLQGNSAVCAADGVAVSGGEIIISEPGEYELSGSLENGRILIRTEEKTGEVALILNGVHISCEDGPAIEEQEAGKLILLLPEGAENLVHSGGKEIPAPDPDAVGAAIQAEDALVIQGGGNLTVEGFLNNGLAGKKELSILGCNLRISASNCGVSIAKFIEIRDGSVQITAGNDGLRTHSDKVSGKGDINISGSTLTITADGDGIAAEGSLLIADSKLGVTANGDPELVSSKGIKAGGDTSVTETELTVRCQDNALHGKGSLTFSGGEVKLHSALGKGAHYTGGIRLCNDLTLDTKAAGNGIETDTDLLILDGDVRVTAGGDGLRAGDSGTGKGSFRMEGGLVRVSAANDALDAKISMSISGGRLFAAGNSYRLKRFLSDSGQASLCAELAEAAAGRIEVRTADGTVLDSLDLAYPAGTVYFSSPALNRGGDYELHGGAAVCPVTAG